MKNRDKFINTKTNEKPKKVWVYGGMGATPTVCVRYKVPFQVSVNQVSHLPLLLGFPTFFTCFWKILFDELMKTVTYLKESTSSEPSLPFPIKDMVSVCVVDNWEGLGGGGSLQPFRVNPTVKEGEWKIRGYTAQLLCFRLCFVSLCRLHECAEAAYICSHSQK
jgi:hypothetical protein